MAGAGVTRIGQLDLQFQSAWDPVKANRLVETLTQVISTVNGQAAQIAKIAADESAGIVPHVLAGETGLGPYHTVSGLAQGQVLVATSPTSADFAFLSFGQMAQTDAATFLSPAEGDVITFHDGYWSAMAPDPLGVVPPGSNALLMWNEGGMVYGWAVPDGTILLTAGAIGVNQADLDHSKFAGLEYTVASGGTVIANDHPQYALLSAANTWALEQTFAEGLLSESDIDLIGNIEQQGIEGLEYRSALTDDTVDEGTWRLHVESGMLLFATVSDDGSDGEAWLSVSRAAELADQVNVSANAFTFNGDTVATFANIVGSSTVWLGLDPFGNLQINAALGSGGGGGVSTVTGASSYVSVTGSTNVSVDLSSSSKTSLGLANSALQPITGLSGTYTNTNLTINASGQITAASNGSGGGGVSSVTGGSSYVSVTGSSSVTVDLSTSSKTSLGLANSALQPIGSLSGTYTYADITLNSSGQITAAASGQTPQFTRGAGWNSSGAAIVVANTVPIDIVIPYACVLQEVIITPQGGSGSCTVSVWKAALGSYPPTSGGDMTGGVPPAIAASATPYANSALSGWTTACAQNDVIRLTLAANINFTSVEISLRFQ